MYFISDCYGSENKGHPNSWIPYNILFLHLEVVFRIV